MGMGLGLELELIPSKTYPLILVFVSRKSPLFTCKLFLTSLFHFSTVPHNLIFLCQFLKSTLPKRTPNQSKINKLTSVQILLAEYQE